MAKLFNASYGNTQVIDTTSAVIQYSKFENGRLNPSDPGQSTWKDNGISSLPFGISRLVLQLQRPTNQQFSIARTAAGKAQRFIYTGSTTGQLRIDGLFGPTAALTQLAEDLADPCSTISFYINLGVGAGCGSTNKAQQKLVAFGCVLNSFGLDIQQGQAGIATIAYPLSFSVSGVEVL